MSEMISSIGSFLSAGSKPLNGLLGLAGVGTNIYSGIQQSEEQSRLAGAQKYLTGLLTNPKKMSAATAAFQQPLTAGLTAELSNQVQGNLAERGLGSSPAAYTQQLTQAIAPYVQQNQGTALSALMQSLGLTSNLRSTASPTQDISKLLAQLKIGGAGQADPYSTLYGAVNTPDNLAPTNTDSTELLPMAA